MEEGSSGESRSWRGRGREAARRVTKPISSAADAVTGRGVAQRVAEYSETFTQVALGMHEDMAAASRRIGNVEAMVAEIGNRVTSGEQRIGNVEAMVAEFGNRLTSGEQHGKGDKKVYLLAAAALIIGLVALGVALWAAL